VAATAWLLRPRLPLRGCHCVAATAWLPLRGCHSVATTAWPPQRGLRKNWPCAAATAWPPPPEYHCVVATAWPPRRDDHCVAASARLSEKAATAWQTLGTVSTAWIGIPRHATAWRAIHTYNSVTVYRRADHRMSKTFGTVRCDGYLQIYILLPQKLVERQCHCCLYVKKQTSERC